MRTALLFNDMEGPAGVTLGVLEGGGYAADWARTPAAVLASVRADAPDVILLDQHATGLSGLPGRIRAISPRPVILLLATMHRTDGSIHRLGADGYVRYPVGSTLLAVMDRHVRRVARDAGEAIPTRAG